jgi:hypothetical protein
MEIPLAGETMMGAPPGKPRHVQFIPDALDRLAELGLGKGASALLAWLVLLVSPGKRTLRRTVTDLAEELGMGRRRMAELIEELASAGLIEWKPQMGGKAGELRVVCYDRLAAQGRRDGSSWVPIFPEALHDWCCSRGLYFDSRDVLLRLVLRADYPSGAVGRSVTDLAIRIGVNRRRSAGLEKELCGALERHPKEGFRLAIYSGVVRVGTPGAHRSQPSFPGKPQELRAETRGEGDRSPGSLSTKPQELCAEARGTGDVGSRVWARRSRASARSAARLGAESQGFFDPPSSTYLPSFPCETSEAETPTAKAEGKEGDGCKGLDGDRLVAEFAARLGQHKGDLLDGRNFQGRKVLGSRLSHLLESGWGRQELLDHLTERMQGAGSVMAVALARSKGLPLEPPSAQSQQAAVELEAERRRRQLEQAEGYARRRAVIDLTDDELDEDLIRVYGSDPGLLEPARTAAKQVRAAIGAPAEGSLDAAVAIAATSGR